MTPTFLVVVAFLALFTLIVLRVPLGLAMLVVGLWGFAQQTGWAPALSTLASEVVTWYASPDLAMVPLFLLMGMFANAAGLSADLYRVSDAWVGHRRGGLALATLGTCAGFGALCGSTLATVGTMTQIAYPEMERRGYAPHFAAATVAVGSTMGVLVPPSIILVLYAVLTESFVLDLYLGALVPSALALALYGLAVVIYARRSPAYAPAGARRSWRERGVEMRKAWGVLLLVALVMGGIYGGMFTALEAAAVGAIGTFVFALARGACGWRPLLEICAYTARTTGMILVMVIGASVFSYFISYSGVPQQLVSILAESGLPPWLLIAGILVVYIILGAIFDEVASMLLTLPFVLPLIVSLGYDPVWWGIINVSVIMIGLFCPPIGMNVMIVHALLKQIPLGRIYRGVGLYLAADLLRLALLVAFPALVTWLPSVLR